MHILLNSGLPIFIKMLIVFCFLACSCFGVQLHHRLLSAQVFVFVFFLIGWLQTSVINIKKALDLQLTQKRHVDHEQMAELHMYII